MFLFNFCFCRLIKVARQSSGVHLFVLITNLVCVGVTLLRGAPVYFYEVSGTRKCTKNPEISKSGLVGLVGLIGLGSLGGLGPTGAFPTLSFRQ